MKIRRDPLEMSEKQFEGAIKKLAGLYGYLYYHTYRSQKSPAGFPDCVLVGYGRVIYAELKTAKGQPTAEQYEWLLALHDAGQNVFLWRPDDIEDIANILATSRN